VNCKANEEWVVSKCLCKAGFVANGGVCIACPVGTQANA